MHRIDLETSKRVFYILTNRLIATSGSNRLLSRSWWSWTGGDVSQGPQERGLSDLCLRKSRTSQYFLVWVDDVIPCEADRQFFISNYFDWLKLEVWVRGLKVLVKLLDFQVLLRHWSHWTMVRFIALYFIKRSGLWRVSWFKTFPPLWTLFGYKLIQPFNIVRRELLQVNLERTFQHKDEVGFVNSGWIRQLLVKT